MGELIHERDGWRTGDDRIRIHLLDHHAAMLHAAARDRFEAVQELLGLGTPVRLDEADDEVRPALRSAMTLLQHAERLPDTRCHAEVDAQSTATVVARSARAGEHLFRGRARRVAVRGHRRDPSRSRLTSSTLTRGWPMNPNSTPPV